MIDITAEFGFLTSYDCYLMELWKRLQETGDGTSEWADFDDFERFMCKYLV